VDVLFARSSFDADPVQSDDGSMPRRASSDERLLRAYRVELARRTSFWRGRPKRGVSRAELDQVQLHVDLFAAVVAMHRRVLTDSALAQRASSARLGTMISTDPYLPFDAAHWFARDPWYGT
jgi:hypothetical protein